MISSITAPRLAPVPTAPGAAGSGAPAAPAVPNATAPAPEGAKAPRGIAENAKIDQRTIGLKYPGSEDQSTATGVLLMNGHGGGVEIGNLVMGDAPALERFRIGDVVTVTGKLSDNQASLHQSGDNYDVAAGKLFTGTALRQGTPSLFDGTADPNVQFKDGRIVDNA